MANISIDQLAGEITKAVQEYTQDVTEAIDKTVDDTAKKVLKEVKQLAPRDTGEYVKGFTITKEEDDTGRRRIIWNKKHGWKAHLLEFGRNTKTGKRVTGKAHFRPAYDKYAADLPEQIKSIIKGGGIK